jgi:hypothetical protein
MLMTAFQHKAAAAANGTLHNGEGSIPEYSPDHSSILRPSDYLTGSTSLPHMPWDFMSQGPSEEKVHSMTSSMLSQDNLSQQPYVYMGSIQPAQSNLPPVVERQESIGNSLPPAFPTMADPFNVSGSPTPNDLSPFPSMTGSVFPVNLGHRPDPDTPPSLSWCSAEQ